MTTTKQVIAEFREEYKKAYAGFLPESVLEEGNEWFESFITSKLEERTKEIIELVEGMSIYEPVHNGALDTLVHTLKSTYEI